MKKKTFTLGLLIISLKLYGLQITEILINYPYESNYCQYIEIFNNSPNPIDLRDFKLSVQGYEIKITNLYLSDFETEGITNSFILNSSNIAVILPYSYSYSSKPFYFPSNTLILTTSTKYLAKEIPLNYNIVSTVKLISNTTTIDQVNTGSLTLNSISLERNGTLFYSTGNPSPGYIDKDKRIWFSKYLYNPNEIVEVFLNFQTNSDRLNVKLIGKGDIVVSKIGQNLYKGYITGFNNGERIVAKYDNLNSTSKILNLFDTNSSIYEKLLVNEVCFAPSKTWYSILQGDTPQEIGREIDKYFEIVNLHSNIIYITNLYIHCISRDMEVYYNLAERAYFSSKRGFLTNPVYIEPYEYLISSTPKITSNMVFTIKDNHPYKGGKIISFIEEKNLKLIPYSHSNEYMYLGYRTASLLPNALSIELGGKYRSWSETIARYNGYQEPSIFVDSKYKKIGTTVRIIIVDEVWNNYLTLKLISRNFGTTRILNITNQGLYYLGEYKISKEPFDGIYATEEDEIIIEYHKDGITYRENFLAIPQNVKDIIPKETPFLEKTILKYGDKIRVLNSSRGDKITLYDKSGNFILSLNIDRNNSFEISSTFMSKNNLYIVLIERDNKKYIHKLFILE
ncbi:MAG: lamin tail domain-containing protein [Brevinematales bacterium]|nr:lamin tail domain-containing protein [Brevinematales bacterium]